MQTIELKNTTTTHNSNLIIKPTNVRNKRIPQFPNFKPLELSDREEIEAYVRQFPPYSDFNFVSLWCYNTKNYIRLSKLNNNLVIRFSDYISNDSYYSVLGIDKINNTICEVREYARVGNSSTILRLVPEDVVKLIDTSLFNIEEDIDNHDYVYSTIDTMNLKGHKYRGKKNFVNRFKKLYPGVLCRDIQSYNEEIKGDMMALFHNWADAKSVESVNKFNEYLAFDRFFSLVNYDNFYCCGLYDDNKLIAFSINEVVHNSSAVLHFEKADVSYIGAYQYLKKLTSTELFSRGCLWYNTEQDLGIPDLRKSKKSWQPTRMYKKYMVASKEN